MVNKKIIIGMAGLFVGSAVIAGSGYAGYQKRHTTHEAEIITQAVETTAATEEAYETTAATDEAVSKSSEKKNKKKAGEQAVPSLNDIKKLSAKTDPNNLKDMETLAKSMQMYIKAQNYTVEQFTEQDNFIAEYFPEAPGLDGVLRLSESADSMVANRRTSYLDFYFRGYSYEITPPIANETTVSLDGYDITLGKTTLSDLEPLWRSKGAYAYTVQNSGGYNKDIHAHHGLVLDLQTAEGKSDGRFKIEFVPTTGVIIGLQIYIDDFDETYDDFDWHLNNDMYKNLYLQDVEAYYGTPLEKSDDEICYGNGTTEDQITFHAMYKSPVYIMTYALASDRIQIIEAD